MIPKFRGRAACAEEGSAANTEATCPAFAGTANTFGYQRRRAAIGEGLPAPFGVILTIPPLPTPPAALPVPKPPSPLANSDNPCRSVVELAVAVADGDMNIDRRYRFLRPRMPGTAADAIGARQN